MKVRAMLTESGKFSVASAEMVPKQEHAPPHRHQNNSMSAAFPLSRDAYPQHHPFCLRSAMAVNAIYEIMAEPIPAHKG
jgi:hypothetical protein